MALSCISCEIKRDTDRKSGDFLYPLAFDALVRGSPSNISIPFRFGVKNVRMVGLSDGEITFEDMYNRL